MIPMLKVFFSKFFRTADSFRVATQNICTTFSAPPYGCVVKVQDTAPTNFREAETYLSCVRDLTIMYDSETANITWEDFLDKLVLEIAAI